MNTTLNKDSNAVAKSFTVNDAKGNLKEGIIHCFISRILLDTSNPPATIRANNGRIYQTIYDNFQPPTANSNPIIEVLASFQSWNDGNFVVIRNLSALRAANKGESL